MTIAEFIKELQEYPQDSEIMIRKETYDRPHQLYPIYDYVDIYLHETKDNRVYIEVWGRYNFVKPNGNYNNRVSK